MDTALILLFFKSALIGLSIAAPVGPIGLLCIQRTLDHGPRTGLATGLGAAVADAVYGAIGAFGVTAVINAMTGARDILGLGGAIFLMWMAWAAWRSADPKQAASTSQGIVGWHAFLGTFVLTISNPTTILAFIAVFSALAGSFKSNSPGLMVVGVFFGSVAWWLILVSLVGRFRARLEMRHLRAIRRGSAVLLAGFAVYQLAAVLLR
jgi:threonine/homoserine/homoserine lactone efflux protein